MSVNEDRGEGAITINGTTIEVHITFDIIKRVEHAVGKNLRVLISTIINPMEGYLTDIIQVLYYTQKNTTYNQMDLYYMIMDDIKDIREVDFYLRVVNTFLPLLLGKPLPELEEEQAKKK